MSSLSSPDFFDSPSPEEEKEEHISLPPKVAEPLKKAKTVTISLVSDNKTSLPTKPGSLISGSNVPSSLSSSSSSAFHSVSVGTAGHRSNSPSLFSTEGKPKTDQTSQGEAALEELRTQVKELRTIIETMKDQQKKEIKQLLSELDEEKKIRLRLQVLVHYREKEPSIIGFNIKSGPFSSNHGFSYGPAFHSSIIWMISLKAAI
ncbi:UNVERIFIED_CONTAM: SH3 domain-containing kinase-binding protein 1 [Gekko kuhli]